jgi:hypothetical protein
VADDPYASLGVPLDAAPASGPAAAPAAPVSTPAPQSDPYSHLGTPEDQPAQLHHYRVKAPNGHTYEFDAPADSTPQELDALSRKAAGYGDHYRVVTEQPGIGEQLLSATENVAARGVQGAAALPDLAAENLGKVLSAVPNLISQGLKAAGHDEAADWIQKNITHNLANPVQIGDVVEKVSPTPDTTAAHVAGFLSQLAGGAVTVPASATDAILARIYGEVPKVPVVAKPTAKTLNQDFAQAADRQGIDYMAADLPKAMKSKFATSLSGLTLGGIPLAEQGAKNAASAGAAVDRAAAAIGSVADKTGAGQAAQRGAKQFMDSTAETLDNLESKIPISAAAPANVSNTRTALTNLSESFASNPKLAEAFRDPRVSKFLDALTPQEEATGILDASGKPITRPQGGGLSWDDLRSFRSRVGEIIGRPGLASDGAQISQLRSLYGALSNDIRQTATQYGPKAEAAWSRWNNFARARSDRIENVVSLILGKDGERGPQSAFETMQRLASDKGGDPLKLARALRSMPEEEANSVRATILDDLWDGSTDKFVTNWSKISERAKNVLFTGEHRDAINDIVKVMTGMKASTKFANTSKTGIGVIASTHTIPALIANPILGAIDMALQYGGGKLLASPGVARKIAGTPLNAKGAASYWSRPWVDALAAKNPVIAGEIIAFRKAILAHANDNVVSSAAASPDANQQDQQQ